MTWFIYIYIYQGYRAVAWQPASPACHAVSVQNYIIIITVGRKLAVAAEYHTLCVYHYVCV